MDAPVAEVIAVTDKAARRIAALADKEGRTRSVLRVRVTAGGCSGFTYELSFADRPAEDDAVVEAADGVRVLVDPTSAPIVRGSTLSSTTRSWAAAKMINHRPRTSAPAATRSASRQRPASPAGANVLSSSTSAEGLKRR